MIHSLIHNNLPPSATVTDAQKYKRYELLVTTYHADLYRYAFWLCKDKHISEDLVQDTCLRAWRSLDSLLDHKAAKAWLITILRRENARRFERKQFDLVDIDEPGHEGKTHDEGHHEHEWLKKQILKLNPDYREPLFLQVIGGFSGEEIANILELNKNTVMTRLFRARNQLKDALNCAKNQELTPSDRRLFAELEQVS